MNGPGTAKQPARRKTALRYALSVVTAAVMFSSIFILAASPAAAASAPVITAVSPSGGCNSGNVEAFVLGTGLEQGCRVLFSRNGMNIEASSVHAVETSRAEFTVDLTRAVPGNWDVRVVNPDGHEGVLAAGFSITEDNSGDPLEPNDTIAQASGPLSRGVATPSYVSRDNDVDWFWLEVPSGSARLVASVKSIPYGCDVDLSVFDANGLAVGSSNNGGDTNELVELFSPVAGRYHLEVKAWSGCSLDDSYLVSYDLANPPALRLLNPSGGAPGTVVTIDGSGFGDNRDGSRVAFGPARCVNSDYLSWSDRRVVVRVPSGAGGAAAVTLTTTSGSSNGVTFKVTPRINRLSSTGGRPGSTLVISGQGFGQWSSGRTAVYFGKMRARTYQAWKDSAIKVKVPGGASGCVKVKVNTPGGTSPAMSYSVKP